MSGYCGVVDLHEQTITIMIQGKIKWEIIEKWHTPLKPVQAPTGWPISLDKHPISI